MRILVTILFSVLAFGLGMLLRCLYDRYHHL